MVKKRKAVAQHVENYKLRTETFLRESKIIRSGFAFDAPSGNISGPRKGDYGARVFNLDCSRVTSVSVAKINALLSDL